MSNAAHPAPQRKIQGNTSREHIHRIFTILRELQQGKKRTKKDLAELCEVHPRTIERDLRTMESVMGVEIVFDRGLGSYRIVGEIKHFPMLKLEDRDLLTLHFLRQCLVPYNGTSIGRSMIESFERAFGMLTGTTNWQKWETSVAFRFEGRPEAGGDDVNVFNVLHQAIGERERVTFVYHPPGRPPEKRTVEPLFIYMRSGRWYLYAAKEGKPEKRTFAFPRISKASSTGVKFVPPQIKPGDCFRYSFGVVIAPNKPRENVVLDFAPEVAQRVRESLWHPEQQFKKLPGGGVRLTVPFAEESYLELKPWLLSWGPMVTVVAPAQLAEQLKETILQMAKKA